MKAAMHTRGPWLIAKHATPDYAPQYGIYTAVASHDHVIVKGDNAEADAFLIAAAPTLLDKAKAVVAAWEHGDLAAAVRELSKAITEAEGDQ